MISTGRLQRMHARVYRLASIPPAWRQEVKAAQLSIGRGAVAFRRTAATLLQLRGFEPGLIELATDRNVRARDGVAVHRVKDLPIADVTSLYGIESTTPARTLIDLAAVVGVEALEAAVDDALLRGLVSVSGLEWRLGRPGHQGRVGTRAMRSVLEDRRAGYVPPDGPLENAFMRLIRRENLPLPVLQYRVQRRGRSVARLDAAYPELLVGIELDSRRWHVGTSDWERNVHQRTALAAMGWTILVFTWDDVKLRPSYVTETIRGALGLR